MTVTRNVMETTKRVIFHEATVAAIQSYSLHDSSTVEFLKLFRKWWIISNFKTAFSTKNYIGNEGS